MKRSDSIPTGLRRLYLTLFLRGHHARAADKKRPPRSIGRKLAGTLALWTLIGGYAAALDVEDGTFALSLFLHSTTLFQMVFYATSSAGEILFNPAEPDILLHRPVTAGQILRAKVRVMTEVGLWMAVALNMVGLFAGTLGSDGRLLFLPAHLLSLTLNTLFHTAGVVLVYQLCLRWFRKERLDNLMTAAQVLLIGILLGGSQILPRLGLDFTAVADLGTPPWWMFAYPPYWFAGLDSLLLGHVSAAAGVLAGLALLCPLVTSWLAVKKLATGYQRGLQALAESGPRPDGTARGERRLARLLARAPLRWLWRDPRVKMGFHLTAAYLMRDRATKLRFYPGIAPILILPVAMLFPSIGEEEAGTDGVFALAFASGYLATMPVIALNSIQYSRDWKASAGFHQSPAPGPAPLIHGARLAVNLLVVVPAMLALLGAAAILPGISDDALPLLLPGFVTIPVYGSLTGVIGHGTPLSKPTEAAQGTGRGVRIVFLMLTALPLSGLAFLSWNTGVFPHFLAVETFLATGLHVMFRKKIDRMPWTLLE